MSGSFSDNELYNEFLEEVRDIYDNIESLFSQGQAQKKLNLAQVDELFRYIHTLKGGFSMFNLTRPTTITHKLESFLDKCRKEKIELSLKEINAFTKSMALVKKEVLGESDGETVIVGDFGEVEAVVGTENPDSNYEWGCFGDFAESMDYFIEDQRAAGKHFLIFSASNDQDPELKTMDQLKLERLQEQQVQDNYFILYGTVTSEKDANWQNLLDDLKPFESKFRWVSFKQETPVPIQEQPVQVVEKVNAPIAKQQEILRVPIEQVNDALEGTWEVFLMANKINYLLQNHSHVFKNKPQLYQDFEQIGQNLERNIRLLETKIMHMRMAQLSNVFARMEKVVQKFCHERSRKIQVTIHGEMTKLDKKVVDMLAEPLIHLVRNCMDHGIESPDVRVKNGKSETGHLLIHAEQLGNNVLIKVQDDGQGIDPQKILAKAKSQNMDVSELQTDESIINLIFEPGFSTAEQVSDISGRGVGMDAVRSSVNHIGGKVEVQTRKGLGTTFLITLPLGVSVLSCLLVEINGTQYALDAGLITETKNISLFEIERNNGTSFVRYQENYIPCLLMSKVFQEPEHKKYAPESTNKISCILNYNGGVYSILVDRIIDSISLVAKPLPEFSAQVPFIMSASILPTGAPVFILDGVKILEFFTTTGEVKYAS